MSNSKSKQRAWTLLKCEAVFFVVSAVVFAISFAIEGESGVPWGSLYTGSTILCSTDIANYNYNATEDQTLDPDKIDSICTSAEEYGNDTIINPIASIHLFRSTSFDSTDALSYAVSSLGMTLGFYALAFSVCFICVEGACVKFVEKCCLIVDVILLVASVAIFIAYAATVYQPMAFGNLEAGFNVTGLPLPEGVQRNEWDMKNIQIENDTEGSTIVSTFRNEEGELFWTWNWQWRSRIYETPFDVLPSSNDSSFPDVITIRQEWKEQPPRLNCGTPIVDNFTFVTNCTSIWQMENYGNLEKYAGAERKAAVFEFVTAPILLIWDAALIAATIHMYRNQEIWDKAEEIELQRRQTPDTHAPTTPSLPMQQQNQTFMQQQQPAFMQQQPAFMQQQPVFMQQHPTFMQQQHQTFM